MKIIAIESTHDDTSVVLLDNKRVILEKSISQSKIHKKYGGTIPELASRKHFNNLGKILNYFIKRKVFQQKIDYIAYAATPGLIGSLHMGRIFAEAISQCTNAKLLPINHIYAHIFAICYKEKIIYPAVSLVVSGGHTQLYYVKSVNDIELLGETKDDAAGEVLDKIARELKLGFPGGAIIERLALESLNHKRYNFNFKPKKDLNFSFSGFKTKIINFYNKNKMNINIQDFCYSVQKAIIDYLLFKTKYAIKLKKPKSIILGGGVAANTYLRKRFKNIHNNSLLPLKSFTTDNAKMIGIRGYEKIKKI